MSPQDCLASTSHHLGSDEGVSSSSRPCTKLNENRGQTSRGSHDVADDRARCSMCGARCPRCDLARAPEHAVSPTHLPCCSLPSTHAGGNHGQRSSTRAKSAGVRARCSIIHGQTNSPERGIRGDMRIATTVFLFHAVAACTINDTSPGTVSGTKRMFVTASTY
jgi:hypothetical protein